MLLEVSRPKHLIIGRPPVALADAAVWGRLARFVVAVVVASDDMDVWEAAVNELPFVHLVEYHQSDSYELQSNIRRALDLLDAEPHNSIYITFRAAEELQEAVNTRIGTIQAGGKITEVIPDIFLREFPGDLAEVTNAAGIIRLGHLAEAMAVVADHHAPSAGGQVIWQPRFFARQAHIRDRDAIAEVRLAFLGRYFAASDVRHKKHQLTRRLLKAKAGDAKGAVLSRALGGALHLVASHEPGVDLITRVPPKPSKTDDHLLWLLEMACRRADVKFGDDPPLIERMDAAALRCVREYGPQKEAGSYERRDENVRGAFECGLDLTGKHVVVVDDVVTSGSTAAEAARRLVGAGAESVLVLAIAMNQNVLSAFPLDPPCPARGCEGTLQPLFKNSDPFAMFWGCSRYRAAKCTGAESYYEGLRRSNALNTRDDMPLEEDIEF